MYSDEPESSRVVADAPYRRRHEEEAEDRDRRTGHIYVSDGRFIGKEREEARIRVHRDDAVEGIYEADDGDRIDYRGFRERARDCLHCVNYSANPVIVWCG